MLTFGKSFALQNFCPVTKFGLFQKKELVTYKRFIELDLEELCMP